MAVFPFISELFEGFGGSASPEDLETLFQLITLYATEPRLDQAVFERYQARLHSIAEINAAQPDSVLFNTVNRVLAQGHLRQRPLTVELLDELSMERVEAVYADRFADLGGRNLCLCRRIRLGSPALVDRGRIWPALPSAGRAEQWTDHGIDPPAGLIDQVVRSGHRTAQQHRGGVRRRHELEPPGDPYPCSGRGTFCRSACASECGRKLGGTYSIGVNGGGSSLPDAEYLVSIIFGSDPARTEELFAEVLEEITWLQAGGEQEYLDKVKEQLRTLREEELRENRFWLNQIRAAAQRG